MNPHFIFNALSSIQNLINQKKNGEANQYLLNFSSLLRMVLATSEKKLISVSEEAAQLRLYLQLEQLRVPFEFRIEIDDTVQPDIEEIPGMLLQPVVENAVKHGVSHVRDGMITIRFSKEERLLFAEITDNGAGFPAQAQLQNGFGLKATEERLRLINEEFKTKIGIMHYESIPVYGHLTLTATFAPEQYPITYHLHNGGGGVDASLTNPASYTVESADITLIAPVKAGDEFVGWTGANGDTPQLTVTIPHGSVGERIYYANYLRSGRAVSTEPIALDGDRIWASKGELYVRTVKPGSVLRIYSAGGVLLRQQVLLQAGETKIKLPDGVYVGTLNNGLGQTVIISD
jgi:uncharacterized repeat protein (TIGR02543 family)